MADSELSRLLAARVENENAVRGKLNEFAEALGPVPTASAF